MGGSDMECRADCGACCTAPSIVRPYYGMPRGKPAGVTCVHLDAARSCRLFGDPRRPAACAAFTAEPAVCGRNREEALVLLTELEAWSRPA
ncbi:MAG: YkgJ family cysteine cluster protein [Parahaliea sp.]